MNITVKEKLPLLFLLAISLSWGFYYQGEHWFNNYGAANFEWLFLLDALLVLPLLLELRRVIRNSDLSALRARAGKLLQARDRAGIERWLKAATSI